MPSIVNAPALPPDCNINWLSDLITISPAAAEVEDALETNKLLKIVLLNIEVGVVEVGVAFKLFIDNVELEDNEFKLVILLLMLHLNYSLIKLN